MRKGWIVLSMLLCLATPATAQLSVNVALPGVSIGFNQPVYPELLTIPGYPVYYAPQVNANYFFYDGIYWVYVRDNWYASSWYNGPWEFVPPEAVPLFVLRIPLRYYREPPAYFRGWSSDAPPRWGDHWGAAWEQRRQGWDSWNHNSVPAPAPLPVYQRQYSGNRYPPATQQQVLQSKNYRYQPQDSVAQQYYQAHRAQAAPASPQQGTVGAARGQPPQKAGGESESPAVAKAPAQQPKAQAPRGSLAKAPEPEPKAQVQRATVAKAPAQEPKAQTQKAAVARAPAQESKAQSQKPAAAKAAPQEPARPATKAPEAEPKEGQQKGREQG